MTRDDAGAGWLTIGALAREAGVHVETVRYYQRRGLLPVPERPLGGAGGGVRRYPRHLVQRLRFIKRAQALGFSLAEIGQLLALGEGRGRCEDLRRQAEAKREAVESRIRDLLRLRQSLDRLIEACRREGGPSRCPLVDSLLEEERMEGEGT